MTNENSNTALAPTSQQQTGLRATPLYSGNPFLNGTLISVQGKKKRYNVATKADLIVSPEGEVSGGIEHVITRIVDDSKFVKLFVEGMRGMYDLSSPGMKMFCYLYEQVQNKPNTDKFYLYGPECEKEPWGIKRNTFYSGVLELVTKGFVARSDAKHMFYLNPAMIWNGDRFTFINEYKKASSNDPVEHKFIEDLKLRNVYRHLAAGKVVTPTESLDELQAKLEAAGQQRLDV